MNGGWWESTRHVDLFFADADSSRRGRLAVLKCEPGLAGAKHFPPPAGAAGNPFDPAPGKLAPTISGADCRRRHSIYGLLHAIGWLVGAPFSSSLNMIAEACARECARAPEYLLFLQKQNRRVPCGAGLALSGA